MTEAEARKRFGQQEKRCKNCRHVRWYDAWHCRCALEEGQRMRDPLDQCRRFAEKRYEVTP